MLELGVGGGLAWLCGGGETAFESDVRALIANAASVDCWSISDIDVGRYYSLISCFNI